MYYCGTIVAPWYMHIQY